MTDVFTSAKRSEVMSKIKSRGNRGTELRLASLFRKYGIHGWRRHLAITGRPDFTFKSHRVVVFVDGCFWHHCPKCGNMPASNREFWRDKLAANTQRDHKVNKLLSKKGWHVLRIWEHELCNGEKVIAYVRAALALNQ